MCIFSGCTECAIGQHPMDKTVQCTLISSFFKHQQKSNKTVMLCISYLVALSGFQRWKFPGHEVEGTYPIIKQNLAAPWKRKNQPNRFHAKKCVRLPSPLLDVHKWSTCPLFAGTLNTVKEKRERFLAASSCSLRFVLSHQYFQHRVK